MKRVNKAFLGAVLLAGTALAVSPTKAQVGTDPNYGDPSYSQGYGYDQGYSYGQGFDSNGYDPSYNYDQGYDPSAGAYVDPYAGNYDPYYDPSYNPYCDYYTPPWGYPPDYCRYQTWNQPVYSGGIWYSGPIYYRVLNNLNWFWLNGGWHRDEWYGGARPYVDWSRGGHQRWNGPINRWRDQYARGTWAGRNSWVGRNYGSNYESARSVLNRARDRNFGTGDFRGRNGDVTGGQFGGRDFTNGGSGRGNGFSGGDRRGLRDGGSNLIAPNNGPRVGGAGPRFGGRDGGRQNNLAAPNSGPRVGGGGPRLDNRGFGRNNFAVPNSGPRVGGAGPRSNNRGFSGGGGGRSSFAAPNNGPRVGGGGRSFGNGGGGGPRAFTGGGGGGRSFANRGGGGGGNGISRGGGGGSRGRGH